MKYELKEDDIVDIGFCRGVSIKMANPDRGDYIQRSIRAEKKMYQEKILNDVLKFMPRCPNVVDIGAYTGSSVIWFALVAGARHITAIEPDEYFYSILNANIEINGLSDSVDLVNQAIGADDGYARLFYTSATNLGGTVYRACDKDDVDCVPMAKLDSILGPDHDKVDVLHISMEGNEYEAIKGAENVIRQDRPVIVISLWGPKAAPKVPGYDCFYSYARVVGDLIKLGYTMRGKYGDNTVFMYNSDVASENSKVRLAIE